MRLNPVGRIVLHQCLFPHLPARPLASRSQHPYPLRFVEADLELLTALVLIIRFLLIFIFPLELRRLLMGVPSVSLTVSYF